MKEKISEILQLIKNNKKKSIIIAITSIVVLILIITGIVLINFEKRSASSGNVASSNEITTKKNETSKENVSETTSAKTQESATTENNSETTTPEETSSNPEVADNNQVNTVPAAGKLKVTGNHLTDEAGNLVQLRGLSTHGIAWYPDYINENSFREFHDNFGINVIRLAMYQVMAE